MLAKNMRQVLEPYLGDGVEIKMSQDITPGELWRDWIKDQLRDTDLLILLITDSTKSLDWCAYEVGMFTPLSDRKPKPIVCIYPAGEETPSQIRDVQGVECKAEHLKEFLSKLFGGDLLGESINKKVAEDENLLLKLSEDLVKILTLENMSKKNRVFYTRYLSLNIKFASENFERIPPDCEITGDDLSLAVFKLDKERPGGMPWTWEIFRSYFSKTLDDTDSSADLFFDEFERSILASCKGEKITPLQHYIRSLTSDKKYHPVIHQRDYLGSNHFKIRVLLVQEAEPETGERNYTFASAPG